MISDNLLIALVLGFSLFSFFFGQRKIRTLAKATGEKQHSRDKYHGFYIALFVFLPSILIFTLWQFFSPPIIDNIVQSTILHRADVSPDKSAVPIMLAQAKAVYAGSIPADFVSASIRDIAQYYGELLAYSNTLLVVMIVFWAGVSFALSARRIAVRFTARHSVERVMIWIMIGMSTIAILTTIGIVLSLIFETIRFFEHVPLSEFLFGTHWAPQTAIRADQVGGSGSFGAIPLFAGTFLITLIAMCVAVPVGLMAAIYLSEYASRRTRTLVKPLLEILAGIPTVVYGFFAALTVAPLLRNMGADIGLSLSSESALAAGLVMGIMIIPFISSLSDDVINAVPQTLRDGAAALGATQSETIRQVVLPAALPGIVSAILLAVSRAIGETMIVVMAAGVAANLTANPFESVTTVTVQIVMLLVGDQEFDSAKTLAAFALGMVLFIITLGLNILALYLVRKYREQYE